MPSNGGRRSIDEVAPAGGDAFWRSSLMSLANFRQQPKTLPRGLKSSRRETPPEPLCPW
jgi:hypothetical protein